MPMTPREIKDAIKARGTSMAAIGRRMRPPVSGNVIWANVEQKDGMKSARARRAIARAIGKDVGEVFGDGSSAASPAERDAEQDEEGAAA